MAQRPNLRTRVLLPNKGIVLRHSSVVIQTKSFSGYRVPFLCEVAAPSVSSSNVELSVRTKTNTTARMEFSRGQVLDDYFAIDQAFGSFAVTHDPNLHASLRGVRIRQVKKVITAELRMQRNAHQTAFACTLYIRNHEQRFGSERTVLNYSQTPRTFREDHAAIRRLDDGPWHFESPKHLFDFEARVGLSRSLNFTGPTPGGWLAARKTKRDYQPS